MNQIIFSQTKYQIDFIEFWRGINDHYSYLDQQILIGIKSKKFISLKLSQFQMLMIIFDF